MLCSRVGLKEFLTCFQPKEGTLAIEESLLNYMHCVVIPSSKDVETITTFAIKASFLRWDLYIKSIKDACCIICSLKLCVSV